MFQFARFPSHALGHGWLCIITAGFLHSDVCGSPIICISPQLFAACHVLRRQISPRHPPYALSILTYVFYLDFCFFSPGKGFPLSGFPSVRQKIFLFREIFSFVSSSIQFSKNSSRLVVRDGGDEENRTPDPLLARQVLSQLSYTPMVLFSKLFPSFFLFLLLGKMWWA